MLYCITLLLPLSQSVAVKFAIDVPIIIQGSRIIYMQYLNQPCGSSSLISTKLSDVESKSGVQSLTSLTLTVT